MIKLEENFSLVSVFILLFKRKYSGTEYFFTNGGCKIFADILVNNFGGEIFDYLGHYITKIDDKYYDITGELYGIEEKKLNPIGSCPNMEKKMNTYENIFELVLFNIFKKNEKIYIQQKLQDNVQGTERDARTL